MANLNQTMPRELPSFIDKLLMTCLVNLERIEPFRCEICDKLFCHKESLTDHLATHIKKEVATDFDETMTHGESGCSKHNLDSNTADVGHMFRKIKSEENSVTQGDFLSIRDRIKFETEDTIDAAIRATCGNIKQITSTAVNNNSSKFSDTLCSPNNKLVPFEHVNLENIYGSLVSCKTSMKWHQAMCHKGSQISVEKPKQINLVEQMETKHTCDICWNVFPSYHQLSLHSKFHKSDKSWDCYMCKKTFKFAHKLKSHQRVHTDERPYSCAPCNVKFRNWSSLLYHNQRKHTPAEQQPTCDLCNIRHPNKYSMERHILAVHMTSGYRCRICKNKKEHGHPINLARHMYTHDQPENPFKCHLCNLIFTKKCYKDRHVKLTHEKILNFECDMCKKKFGRKEHLLRHITNRCCQKPYKCRKCKRLFSKLVSFKKHKMKCKKKVA